jgi:hypothetical protein
VVAGAAEPMPRMLPPARGIGLARIDFTKSPYRPIRPAAYASIPFALVKTCVSKTGEVTDVVVLNEAKRFGDEIATKLATWRFDPLEIEGRVWPFCYVVRLDFRE